VGSFEAAVVEVLSQGREDALRVKIAEKRKTLLYARLLVS
jgi:hypothetical protein